MSSRDSVGREGGSLAFTLLAAIVIAGVILALFVTVDTGVQSARFDRDWHVAVNAADAGIQQAVAVIRDEEVDAACGVDQICAGSMENGATFSAEYTQTAGGWIVCSRGEFNDRSRTMCAEFDENLLVGGTGIVGLERVRIDGSFPGTDVPILLGTAGEFSGVANACDSVEGVEIYDPSLADNPCPGKPVSRTQREFPNLAEDAFTDGVCSGDDVPIWDSYPAQRPDDAAQPWQYGQDYCVRFVDIGQNQDISLVGNSAAGPVRIFIDPGSTTAAAAKYAGNGTLNVAGEAIDLQFFVRQGEVDLDMKGNTSINAIWYAPASACDARGNTTFTGAIICRSATVGGNLDFIVPNNIRDVRMGPTVIERVYEQ